MTAPPAQGLHEALITQALSAALRTLEAAGHPVERQVQQLDWLDDALAQHVRRHVESALADLGDDVDARVELVARLLATINSEALSGETPETTREALTWIGPAKTGLVSPKPPQRPEHGLVHPSLLMGGRRDTSLLHELTREFESADRVDAIVSFLRFSGLKLLEPALRRFFERGGRLRLIASTYTGVTEARAAEALVALGGKVRIAYEEDGTRLHAKAWHFRRDSGLSTAYIGSSNLSRSALTDGAEWNVRVTQATTPALVERFGQAFEQLWEALATDLGDPTQLRLSLARARGDQGAADSPLLILDVAPKAHQVRVLDALAAERAHGHWRNLVVAATGTGKTWVAAFDYQRLRDQGDVQSLLFVAHRKEILAQSLLVFRTVLQDPGFGELLVDGARPERGHHVFASVQSLQALQELEPDAVDMLVVDEFHHAAARTYTTLLTHLRPRVLLGLTATPERADGQSVLGWFDQRIAAELRLWDALDEGLLVPFHYFGVHDPSTVGDAWQRGRLQAGLLDGLYARDDVRAQQIVQAVGRYVADPGAMRALGFCVGVGHAQRMARAFNEAGLPALALDGTTSRDVRRDAITRLRAGQLLALFTVDLFNEGVDLPEVDTVLFLRPTESATVFLQQLGRGLRRHRSKAQLVVLDFVGAVHTDYRYELRYQALLGGTRAQVLDHIAADFPLLPPGCSIQLEEQARALVLGAIRRQLRLDSWTRLTDDLRRLPAATGLGGFLVASGAELSDILHPTSSRSWSALRRAAGHEQRPERDGEALLRRAVARMAHVDDDARPGGWSAWLKQDQAPRLDVLDPRDRALATMLLVCLGDRRRPLDEHQAELDRLWTFVVIREELVELLAVLADRLRHTSLPLPTVPVAVHATYQRAELVAAWASTAKGRLRESREGVLYVEDANTDLLFINLHKSDDSFKPSLRYADYPIDSHRFHWESQNQTGSDTAVGKRYTGGQSQVLLFVREQPKDERGETLPFTCLGPATCSASGGSKPMQIVWRLQHALPPWVLQQGRALGLGS